MLLKNYRHSTTIVKTSDARLRSHIRDKRAVKGRGDSIARLITADRFGKIVLMASSTQSPAPVGLAGPDPSFNKTEIANAGQEAPAAVALHDAAATDVSGYAATRRK
jgi:hypothetical protein